MFSPRRVKLTDMCFMNITLVSLEVAHLLTSPVVVPSGDEDQGDPGIIRTDGNNRWIYVNPSGCWLAETKCALLKRPDAPVNNHLCGN